MRITTADVDIGLVSHDTIVPSPAWAKYRQGYAGTDLCPFKNFTTVTTEAAHRRVRVTHSRRTIVLTHVVVVNGRGFRLGNTVSHVRSVQTARSVIIRPKTLGVKDSFISRCALSTFLGKNKCFQYKYACPHCPYIQSLLTL